MPATLNYRETEPQKSDIVKVDILINGKVLDALSFVCHRSKVSRVDDDALCRKESVLAPHPRTFVLIALQCVTM